MISRPNRSGTVKSATLAESITLIRVEFGHQVGLIPGAYRLSVPRGRIAVTQLIINLKSNHDPTLIAAGVGAQPSLFHAVHQARRGRTVLCAFPFPTNSRNRSRSLTHPPECFQHVGGASGHELASQRRERQFEAGPTALFCPRSFAISDRKIKTHVRAVAAGRSTWSHNRADPTPGGFEILAKGCFNRRYLSPDNRVQFARPDARKGANSLEFLKFRRINARARPSIYAMGRRLSQDAQSGAYLATRCHTRVWVDSIPPGALVVNDLGRVAAYDWKNRYPPSR